MPQARFPIVAQNLNRVLDSALLRRAALALVLPFAGVVTAFGIAPDTVTDTVPRSTVVENIKLPTATPGKNPAAQTYWRDERVQRGDTLARMLSRMRIDDDVALDLLGSTPEAQPLFQLTAGRTLRVATNSDGELLTLQYLNGERMVNAQRDGDVFHVEEIAAQLETRVVSAAGVIRHSLFATTDALHIPDAVAGQLVEIFSTEIDFHKDLRKDDRFAVVYEVLTDRAEPVAAGRLLSAEFINQGRKLSVVWFESQPGKGTYYTFDGRDTRKAFLRSPLEFSRISSGFSDARYHPILQSWQAHKGVDYVAPIGTKIRATADGVVDFAGVQQGYGNVVILRHHKKYSTLYAHMSGFEKGIEKGARVTQGDVIGAVGMTGFTTGPHVHYEFRIDEVHHDPLSVDMPQAMPIAPELKPAFQSAAAPFARTLNLLRDAKPSSFE